MAVGAAAPSIAAALLLAAAPADPHYIGASAGSAARRPCLRRRPPPNVAGLLLTVLGAVAATLGVVAGGKSSGGETAIVGGAAWLLQLSPARCGGKWPCSSSWRRFGSKVLRPSGRGVRAGTGPMVWHAAAATEVSTMDTLEASQELQELLAKANRRGSNQRAVDRDLADVLVSRLVAAKVPFNVSNFGGGLWKAAYTSGANTPRWQRNAQRLPFLQNVAGQEYDPVNRSVVNYGEVVGRACYFTAEGSFKEVDTSVSDCPKDYDVFVEKGGISLLGLRVPLPIKGKGYLRCLYADPGVRIFVSPKSSPGKWEEEGLIVVQLPMQSLEPDWKPPYKGRS